MELSDFGRNIRTELGIRKKSISWLAKKSGVSQCMLSYYLCGKSEPTLSKALRIAAALHLPLSQLSGEDTQYHREKTCTDRVSSCTKADHNQGQLYELTLAETEPLRQYSNAVLLAELETRLNQNRR